MELGRHKGTKASSAQSGKLCVFVSLCSVKIIPSYYLIITKHQPNLKKFAKNTAVCFFCRSFARKKKKCNTKHLILKKPDFL